VYDYQPDLKKDAVFDHLKDASFTIADGSLYNVANSDRILREVADTLEGLRIDCGTSDSDVADLFHQLTQPNTTVGFLAQLQGYAWLLKQGILFNPEVSWTSTLAGKAIALDGLIDGNEGLPKILFDIKSCGFEPALRKTYRERLEEQLPGNIVMIDGKGDHNPEAIQAEAFAKIPSVKQGLQSHGRVNLPALNWTVRMSARTTGVHSAIHEYDPNDFIQENLHVPLHFAHQFATDLPFIQVLVLADGLGATPLTSNIFGFSEELASGIAEYLFGPGRSDSTPATDHDPRVLGGRTVGQAIECLSGILLINPQSSVANLHLNGQALNPLSAKIATALTQGWQVREHP